MLIGNQTLVRGRLIFTRSTWGSRLLQVSKQTVAVFVQKESTKEPGAFHSKHGVLSATDLVADEAAKWLAKSEKVICFIGSHPLLTIIRQNEIALPKNYQYRRLQLFEDVTVSQASKYN